jgi:predicted nucleotidyltransferase
MYKDINTILNTKDYDFLHTHPFFGNNIMLLALAGSQAYGTSVEGSDLDIRGVCYENKSTLLGLDKFETYRSNTTDTVIYGFKKLVTMLCSCNPNVLEIIGTHPDQILLLTEEGKMLRNNLNLFITQAAGASYGGFAKQQEKEFAKMFSEDHPKKFKSAMHLIRVVTMGIEMLEGKGLHVYRPDREYLLDIRNGKYTQAELLDMYTELSNKFTYAKEHTSLPKEPDMKKVEELVITINERILKKK